MIESYVCPKCNSTKFIGYDDASGAECKECGHFIPDNELDNYAYVKIKKSELARRDEELALIKRHFRLPTHGSCCTCQRCGQDYDTCRCTLDDVADENEKLKSELASRDEILKNPVAVETAILRNQIVLPDYYIRKTDSGGEYAKLEAEALGYQETIRTLKAKAGKLVESIYVYWQTEEDDDLKLAYSQMVKALK